MHLHLIQNVIIVIISACSNMYLYIVLFKIQNSKLQQFEFRIDSHIEISIISGLVFNTFHLVVKV